ncbi:MAG: hypothetical protein WCK58_18445 [Chloroflexota bacterium]
MDDEVPITPALARIDGLSVPGDRPSEDVPRRPAAPPPPPDPGIETWRFEFGPTSAGRRRMLRARLGAPVLSAAIYLAVIFAFWGADIAAVPRELLLLFGTLTVSSLVVILRLPTPVLTLTSLGVEYDAGRYCLEAPWSAVERLVQLGGNKAGLAIILDRPAVSFELGRRSRPWRSMPFPWDRTIPLFTLIVGERDAEVLRLIASARPDLAAVPVERLRYTAPPIPVRLLGWAAAIVPFLVVVTVVEMVAWPAAGPMFLAGQAAFLALVLALTMYRWGSGTAERLGDWVGRVLLHPRDGESRSDVLRPIAGKWAGVGVFIVFGMIIGLNGSSDEQRLADYGPAHASWIGSTGTVDGCILANGSMVGDSSGTPVTCYVREPLTESSPISCLSHR